MANDPAIRWALASPFGILVDEARDAWYSGHVNDLLELETGVLLVGTETGGVWSVDPVSSPLALSDEWPNPDINCLAFGPDDVHHIFAGCRDAGIRETDLGEPVPLLAWREVADPLPPEAGHVYRILVVRSLRRIVAACHNGLYWATIPDTQPRRGCLMPVGPKPAPRAPYAWRLAKVAGDKDRQGFGDAAIGATRGDQARAELEDRRVITIVAGGRNGGGLFVGQWDGADDLVMRRATLHNDDGTDATGLFSLMGACSVSSCEVRPTTLYAGCAWNDGRLFRVLRSVDGGRSWAMLPGVMGDGSGEELGALAGDQGNRYNNCIAVSPTNPGLVALGWVSLFLTRDGGKTWRLVEDAHIHADLHALRFSPDTSGPVHNNLFVGTDGGVTRVDVDELLDPHPPKSPFQSNYNRMLPTLQCLETRADGRFYGTLGASPTAVGMIATGAQDNGNLHCLLGPAPTPWVDLDGGDGAWNAFIAEGAYLHNTLNGPVAATRLDATAGVVFSTVPPILQPAVPTGLDQPVGDPVAHPTFRNAAGHRLHAVGAVGSEVYGLFVDDIQSPRYFWERLGSIPAGEVAAAVASFHGGAVFVGTRGGKMYTVDSKHGGALELPVILPKPDPHAEVKAGYINRIVVFSESDAFALMNGATAEYTVASPVLGGGTKKVATTSHYVLRLNVLRWEVTPGIGLLNQRMLGLVAVALPGSEVSRALLVSTDDRVHISRDDAATWQPASLGLPRFPHCADLRFAAVQREAHLYLSTYGRSVWVARLA